MFPLSDSEVQALAPGDLPSLRMERYQGDGVSISLAALDGAQADTIRGLYETLQHLYSLVGGFDQATSARIEDLAAAAAQVRWFEMMAALRRLSTEGASADVRRVVHDVRGGAVQALSMYIQLVQAGVAEQHDLVRIMLLTRDHLKIMRNCLPDLDPARYAQDLLDREHSVRLLVEKWDSATYRLPDVTAQIALDCRYDGPVSERCVEFAALDRVLYNLLNNATRHAADGQVFVTIRPVGAAHLSLRFAVVNRIAPEQRERLRARFGDQPGQLFLGGFTTAGTGLGMQICAELVSNAYGLAGGPAAIAGRYVGASVTEDDFVSWFHWPVAAD